MVTKEQMEHDKLKKELELVKDQATIYFKKMWPDLTLDLSVEDNSIIGFPFGYTIDKLEDFRGWELTQYTYHSATFYEPEYYDLESVVSFIPNSLRAIHLLMERVVQDKLYDLFESDFDKLHEQFLAEQEAIDNSDG